MTGDLDLPFEESPAGQRLQIDAGSALLSGGVVILAGVVGDLPVLIYRFSRPDGSGFWPDVILSLEADQWAGLLTLTRDATDSARRAARAAGGRS